VPAEPVLPPRWLVRFGYDGSGFAGWARQPGQRTVEGEIHQGLVRAKIAPSADAGRPRVASRTDRGVHARGNALAISSRLDGPALLRALNGIAPDVFFTHARSVPEAFAARGAASRWYRYFEPSAGRDLGRWREAAELFRGDIDVRSFGRSVDPARPVWRTVDRVEVHGHGDCLVVDVRAPSFVWGMVRKIVAALRGYDSGRFALGTLRAATEGHRRCAVPMAEPERLVLWEVDYPGAWEVEAVGLAGHQRRAARRAQEATSARRAVVSGLWASAPGGLPATPVGRRL